MFLKIKFSGFPRLKKCSEINSGFCIYYTNICKHIHTYTYMCMYILDNLLKYFGIVSWICWKHVLICQHLYLKNSYY